MKLIKATEARHYPICIKENDDDLVDEIIKHVKPSKICIITDSNVEKIYLEAIKLKLETIAPTIQHVFEAGEHAKHLQTVQEVYNTLLQHKMDRSGLIIALGGGVTGDLAGFVASSYMRGIPFVQLPTTIVSQNDSSIGGKVGVDYFAHKNMVGAFYNPILVYTNVSTLETLPSREFIGGISEVIKHGMIKDKHLFEYLLVNREAILNREKTVLIQMTYLSCMVKSEVVAKDLRESGIRKILNFGHTIGHAIETLSDFTLNHGECVAYGMVMAAYISKTRNLIQSKILDSLVDLCKAYGLLNPIPCFDKAQVLEQMTYDKKKAHGQLSFILLEDIGQAIIVNDVSEQEVYEALEYISKTCN